MDTFKNDISSTTTEEVSSIPMLNPNMNILMKWWNNENMHYSDQEFKIFLNSIETYGMDSIVNAGIISACLCRIYNGTLLLNAIRENSIEQTVHNLSNLCDNLDNYEQIKSNFLKAFS